MQKKTMYPVIVILLTVCFLQTNVIADDLEEINKKAKKVTEIVNKAVEHIVKSEDGDKALKDVTDPKGEYTLPDPGGDLYVFIYNMEGTIIAHNNEKLVGKNLFNLKDTKRKNFVAEFTSIAKSKEGEGWSSYHWAKPGETTGSPKLSLIKKVPGKVTYTGKYPGKIGLKVEEEIFLGVGFYLKSDEEFQKVKSQFKNLGYNLWEEQEK